MSVGAAKAWWARPREGGARWETGRGGVMGRRSSTDVEPRVPGRAAGPRWVTEEERPAKEAAVGEIEQKCRKYGWLLAVACDPAPG